MTQRSWLMNFIQMMRMTSETEETKVSGDGNNTVEQKKLGIDIEMIGARPEELERSRSQTKEMMSPKNE